MRKEVKTKGFSATEAISDHIESRYARLDKYLGKDSELKLLLEIEPDGNAKVSATVSLPMNRTIHIEEKHPDMYMAIETSATRLGQALVRNKERNEERHKKGRERWTEEEPEID